MNSFWYMILHEIQLSKLSGYWPNEKVWEGHGPGWNRVQGQGPLLRQVDRVFIDIKCFLMAKT